MNGLRAMGAAVFILCTGAAFAVGHQVQKIDYDAAYIHQRVKVLAEQAQREPDGDVLLIGDSISERSGVHQLCGREVFNAGVSGGKLQDVDALAVSLAGQLKPTRIFVAIGTNDAKSTEQTDPRGWAARYGALVRKFAPVPVVLVPAPVIEPGKKWSHDFSEAHLVQLNGKLAGIAKATGAKLLRRPAVETADAVHPSHSGAAVWRAGLEAGCQI